jgi:hypothetical protein
MSRLALQLYVRGAAAPSTSPCPLAAVAITSAPGPAAPLLPLIAPAGDEVPKGRDALGWHVAVYWKDDKQFYTGQVVDFDANAGKHKVWRGGGDEGALRSIKL